MNTQHMNQHQQDDIIDNNNNNNHTTGTARGLKEESPSLEWNTQKILQTLLGLLEQQYDVTLNYCNSLTAVQNAVSSHNSTSYKFYPESTLLSPWQQQSDVIHKEMDQLLDALSMVQEHRQEMEKLVDILTEISGSKGKNEDNTKASTAPLENEKEAISRSGPSKSFNAGPSSAPFVWNRGKLAAGDMDSVSHDRLQMSSALELPLKHHVDRTQRMLSLIYQQGSTPYSSSGVPLATPVSPIFMSSATTSDQIVDTQTLALSTLQASIQNLLPLVQQLLALQQKQL